MNPPLGEEEDVNSIRAALKDNTIDCIATDHAPHSAAEKELPFEQAPPGFIGLELSFSLAYTYLVKGGVLDLKSLADKLSAAPVRILGLKGIGRIEKGYYADITIADLDKEWAVDPSKLASKSKNTPFIEKTLEGKVQYTIHKGKIVYKDV